MNLNKDYNAVMRGNYGFPCGCSKCRKRFKTDEQRANKRLLWITGLITLFIVMASCAVCHASERINTGLIAQIESGGHPDAYNRHSKAVGLCQITPIVLKEYNNRYGLWYKQEHLYNTDFNFIVADWYINKRIPFIFKHLWIDDNIKNRLWAYNAGVGKVKRGIMPQETKEYIEKYALLMKEIKE